MKWTPVFAASVVIDDGILQQTCSGQTLPEEGDKSIPRKVVGFFFNLRRWTVPKISATFSSSLPGHSKDISHRLDRRSVAVSL